MQAGTKVRVKSVGGNLSELGRVREYDPPYAGLGEGVTIDFDKGGLPGVFYKYPARAHWHVWGAPRGALYVITEA